MADLRIDPASRRVWRGDDEIDLSKTEFELIQLLVRNAGIVLDHSTIYDRIWGYDFVGGPSVIETRVSSLRRKLGRSGADLIHTVRGIGYRIDPPELTN